MASAGYFELMGSPARCAAAPSPNTTMRREQPVVVITEALARGGWPGQDPVGRRIHLGGPQAKRPWMRVVGVVNDVRTERLEDAPRPVLYRPLKQVVEPALFARAQDRRRSADAGGAARARGARRRSGPADLRACGRWTRIVALCDGVAALLDAAARRLRDAWRWCWPRSASTA